MDEYEIYIPDDIDEEYEDLEFQAAWSNAINSMSLYGG